MSYVKLLQGSLERSTLYAAGWDIRCTIREQRLLYPDTIYRLPTGVVTSFTADLVAVVKEKSGLSLKGLQVHAGIIDGDYDKEWEVIATVSKPLAIEPGQKIAQVLFLHLPEFTRVGEGWITKTEVRQNGFGSTGL